ncbi:hypothetical protein BGX34_001756 [Mortierella sp. NVP85]|nr:hypothetical protein BGX34_001756 [Mortierella sp. NVP85]
MAEHTIPCPPLRSRTRAVRRNEFISWQASVVMDVEDFFKKKDNGQWNFKDFKQAFKSQYEATDEECEKAWEADLQTIANCSWTPDNIIKVCQKKLRNPVVDYPTASKADETEAESSSMASGSSHGKRPVPEEPSVRTQASRPPSIRTKKSRSGDWFSLLTQGIKKVTSKLWPDASYETINTIDLQRDQSGKLTDNQSQKPFDFVSVDMLGTTKLPEILELALNNFRYTQQLGLLLDFLEEIYPQMRTHVTTDSLERDTTYIWNVFNTAANLWADSAHKSKMEGWIISYIYAPLMSVFMSIPGTRLEMTEKQGNYYNRATVRVKRAIPDLNMKHDAVLFETAGVKLDLMIMEAKGDRDAGKREKDIQKLLRALTASLDDATTFVPKERVVDLRTFGILITGNKSEFLEARILPEKRVLVYSVGYAAVPDSILNSKQLANTIGMYILFKQRIQKYVVTLSTWQSDKKMSQ